MYYTYILRSIKFPDQCYVGYSKNVEERLRAHNMGQSSYTKKYKPWELETYIAFSEEKKAKNFEMYLKSGSGAAFRKKRL